ncbi:hypothetical protein PAHAL_3G157200 [Panicum hallii]|uniref:Uncharacterized protein n=1 Tax=Panicum hallii TaxID=206008 RepID=A0A2T8KIA2_9POAL|nr:hypothetical protein PAHAL_3G157200 [Panicum hallii]
MCWIVFRGEEDSSTCDQQTRPDQIRPGADRKQPTTRHGLDASPPFCFVLFCPSLLPCQAMYSRLGVLGLDLAKSKGGLLTCCVAIRRVGCTRPCGW